MFGCSYNFEKNMLNSELHRKIKILGSQKTIFFSLIPLILKIEC